MNVNQTAELHSSELARSSTSTRWRRRRYLVNLPYQLRTSAAIATLVAVLLCILNVSVMVLGKASTEATFSANPALAAHFHYRERVNFRLMITVSLVLVLGVFAVAILQSHRTAGAALNLRRCLQEIGRGRYSTVARLRSDDNLQELAATFNQMAVALRTRTREEVEILRRLAAKTRDPELAEELRRLIGGKESALLE